jgi:hypothetical protein
MCGPEQQPLSIVTTKVVRDGGKEGGKTAFFEDPEPARAVWVILKLFRLGLIGWASHGCHSLFETNDIKTRFQSACKPNICTKYDSMQPLSSLYEVFLCIESCMLHTILLFIITN